MADADVIEGRVPFTVPKVDTACFTYYKIIGDLSSNSPRLIVLHGGPGTGHEYLLPFGQLWQSHGIPVVFYDQIGCGASTRLPQTRGDESLWQESLFIAELNNLIEFLHLHDGPGFHLFGHSWGGRIAPAFAASRPEGLRKLILASGVASTETLVEGTRRNRKQLPHETQTALNEEEKQGNFMSPRFREGIDIYLRTYFCRAKPFPPKELLPALKNMSEDTTVRETIAGPSPLNCAGSFRNWTCIPRLHQITAPTLVYNGEFDTSHDNTTKPFFEHISRVRWITFANAGHMCHLEGPEIREKVLSTVGEFLKR
ncbi:hypothetical protein MMC25_002261 [Agyrium rufum]|nr:hypothetical protein [Agyrium rufum]